MSLAPFVSTPANVVEKMLELAKLNPGETLYDLGSGDGRIIIMAAEKYGVNAVGIELNEGRVKESRKKILEKGLEDKVKVIQANFLDVDISSADVVTLYLLQRANKILKPNLERYLKHGARVISHDFEMPGWKPVRVVSVNDSGYYGFNNKNYGTFDSTIYVYEKN